MQPKGERQGTYPLSNPSKVMTQNRKRAPAEQVSQRLAQSKERAIKQQKRWEGIAEATSAIITTEGSDLLDSISSLLAFHFRNDPLSQVEKKMDEQMIATKRGYTRNTNLEAIIPEYRDVLSELLDQMSTLETWILLSIQHSEIASNTSAYQVQSYLLSEIRSTRTQLLKDFADISTYYATREARVAKCGFKVTTVTTDLRNAENGIVITDEVNVDTMIMNTRPDNAIPTPFGMPNHTFKLEKTVQTGPPKPLIDFDRKMAVLTWDVQMFATIQHNLRRHAQIYEVTLTQATKLHSTLENPASRLRYFLCILKLCK